MVSQLGTTKRPFHCETTAALHLLRTAVHLVRKADSASKIVWINKDHGFIDYFSS